MGCLGNIIKILIIALLGLWAVSFLGYGPFGDWLDRWLHPPKEVLMERAQKIRNFDPSLLDAEFEIEKVGGMLDDFNTLTVKHLPTGQKMYMVDQSGKSVLNPKDLVDMDADKLRQVFKEVKSLGVSPDDVQVTKTGLMKAYGEEVPFAEFVGKSSSLGRVPVAGMITTTKDGQQILASTNDNGKYSHFPGDHFFERNLVGHHGPPGLPCVCN